ncbi:uncharacterized protein [Spinacia oleracea]|uniref:Uncharacterized protein isoform X2 n=1 Tax=Spinacia oleracea TaxID=3562 RepID=A0A9R0HWQ3_SPIOL|nr:uncharacterized protein LOC110777900 isoform X2 [Spinacia oleracea]
MFSSVCEIYFPLYVLTSLPPKKKKKKNPKTSWKLYKLRYITFLYVLILKKNYLVKKRNFYIVVWKIFCKVVFFHKKVRESMENNWEKLLALRYLMANSHPFHGAFIPNDVYQFAHGKEEVRPTPNLVRKDHHIMDMEFVNPYYSPQSSTYGSESRRFALETVVTPPAKETAKSMFNRALPQQEAPMFVTSNPYYSPQSSTYSSDSNIFALDTMVTPPAKETAKSFLNRPLPQPKEAPTFNTSNPYYSPVSSTYNSCSTRKFALKTKETPPPTKEAANSKLHQALPIQSKNAPTVSPHLTSPDWSPLDDNITITYASSNETPPRKAIDEHMHRAIYGPTQMKRLPVFVDICL